MISLINCQSLIGGLYVVFSYFLSCSNNMFRQQLIALMLCVQIHLLYPQPGFVEMDEMLIWQQAQDVIKDAISSEDNFFVKYFAVHLFPVCNRDLCVTAVWPPPVAW